MPELVFSTFAGGLWIPGERSSEQQPDFSLSSNALLKADNVEFLDSGGLRGRRGRARYGTDALPGEVVQMFRHYPRNGPIERGDATPKFVNENSVGTEAWNDFQNAESADDDNAYAYCDFATPFLVSNRLQATNPYLSGLEVPGAFEVTGIVVEIRRRATPNPGVRDYVVQLISGLVPVGENKAVTDQTWTTQFETAYYGGPGDLWGFEWTAGLINSPGFGLAIQAESTLTIQQAQIEYVDIHVYMRASIPPSFLVAWKDAGDKVIYSQPNGGGGWNQLQTNLDPLAVPVNYEPDLGTEHRPRFVSWHSQDRTYIFDGRNPVMVWDGEYLHPGPVDARRGPYATLWKARLWAADPNELEYSVYASGINDPDLWDLGRSQLNVADTRGGKIVGLVGWRDQLLIFKNSGLWSFMGDVDTGGQLIEYAPERGCEAPESIAETPFGVLYVGSEGVYITDGRDPLGIEVSRPLRSLFVRRLTDAQYPNAVGIYYPTKQQYYLKLDPAEDEVFVLTIVPGSEGGLLYSWAHIPVMPLNTAMVWSNEPDTGELLLGDVDGFVYQGDVGSTDQLVGGTDPIACTVRTTSQRFASKGVEGRITHAKAHYRGAVPLSGALTYDQETTVNGIALGIVSSPATNQFPRAWVSSLDTFGRHVDIELSNPSDGPAFELHEIRLRTALRQPRRWRGQ